MNFNEQLKRLEQQENEKGLFKKSHRAQEPEQTQPQQAAENAQAQPEEAQLQQAAFTAGPQQETVKNVNEPLVQQEPLQFAQDSDVKSTGEESKKIKKGIRRFKAAVALTIVVLAVGVAANWYWENSDISDSIQPVLSAVEEKTKTIGEATYVDATTEATTQNEYFSTARVERQQARDEALENLQSVADGATGSVKENAEANIEKISSYITIENKIETLVKA